jgi:hypothetical protein
MLGRVVGGGDVGGRRSVVEVEGVKMRNISTGIEGFKILKSIMFAVICHIFLKKLDVVILDSYC